MVDPITPINLALCIIILALGILAYLRKKRYDVPLYIGIAFGLFGVSHLIALLGLAAGMTAFLVLLRLLGYLLVIFALYRILAKK